MDKNFFIHRQNEATISLCWWLTLLVGQLGSFHFSSALWAQSYPIKNDRILAPEVSHFARITEPGVDAHGDLSLSIPLMTIPGRDGLDFDIVVNYHSGIQVTQSASWIGLGWELDLGSITRHTLGALANYDMTDGDAEHDDWAYAIATAHGDVHNRKIDSQPDVYMVNLNGNSTLLLSMTLETNPPLPFTPARTYESGPCFQGQTSAASLWYFIPSPWRPWKFCYALANPVFVDQENTDYAEIGAAGYRQDFAKFTITIEDGTRYVLNHSGRTKYLPDQEYRWRNNVTSATMPAFDWSNPDTTKWIRTQTFLGYDDYGNLTRFRDAYNMETSVF